MTSASGTCVGGILNLPLSLMAPVQQATHTERQQCQQRPEWAAWMLIWIYVKRSSVTWLQPSARWHVLEVCVVALGQWVYGGSPLGLTWCWGSKSDDKRALWLMINVIFLLQKLWELLKRMWSWRPVREKQDRQELDPYSHCALTEPSE